MLQQPHNSIFILLITACIGIGSGIEYHHAVPYAAVGALASEFESGTMVFVGDIMLGRDVEKKMEQYGEQYPFAEVQAVLEHTDVAIGNFEGAIPPIHRPTPPYALQFSMKSTTMQLLRASGFDGMSLANNHAYDYGVSGYANTQQVCAISGVACVGHPGHIAEPYTVTVGSTEVAMLALHAVDTEPDAAALERTLTQMTATSDIQIVYIHWGIEYEENHSTSQETLAKTLIDGGVDAVIGHHPHVVQDIEVYNGAPIFYSLGNFVFDQYFSDAVQTGLMVRIEVAADVLRYTLIPVESRDTHAQPAIMDVDARDAFIADIRERSTGVAPHFRDGALVFAR